MIRSLIKPWFLYRPLQIVRRLKFGMSRHGKTEVLLPWGTRISVDSSKTIGKSICATGIYDLSVSEMLWRLIEPGNTVVDVGANIGYMTALMAHRVGKDGDVLAIEAHPNIYETLTNNVAQIRTSDPDCGTIVTYNNAASDSGGVVSLVCPDNFAENDGVAYVSSTSASDSIQVDALTLDSLLKVHKTASLIKIDVEGHELHVLKGAVAALESQIKHVVYEEHSVANSPVSEFLENAGFTIFQFGWTMRQLVLSTCDGESLAHSYEAPNLLATKSPEHVIEKCRTAGWGVLKGKVR